MTWKLPKHLEPYRECIDFDTEIYDSVEDVMKTKFGYSVEKVYAQVDLLQLLYDAGKLK